MKDFNFEKAQKFELDFHKQYINMVFKKEYDEWIINKELQKDGLIADVLIKMWGNNFFNNDIEFTENFIEHIKDKNSLDIGSGCIPWVKDTFKVKKQYIIDPLGSEYKRIENELFGVSFFENCELYSIPAENIITELIDNIDGFIFCRNTIDHSEYPFSILENISKYAKRGCYLLFWCDIWHYNGGDDGHHSITQNPLEMDEKFIELGFKKLQTMPSIRSDKNRYLDYG